MTTTLPGKVTTIHPPAPRLSVDTGLSPAFLSGLILKTFYYRNEMIGREVGRSVRLPFSVVKEHIEDLRRDKLIEVKGAEGMNLATYRLAITQIGRERARELIKISQYVGPAPVPLQDYSDGLRAQVRGREPVNARILGESLSHLVLPARTVQQIGPALNARKSLFLYGSPGNGKTVIAEAIGRALGGDLLIPHAVEVDNQVIKLVDPVFHGEPGEDAPPTPVSAIGEERNDARWVRTRRPVIFAGGELTLEMLDLNFNVREGFYEAPLQMKANGGVFIIDDFGRQMVQPRDLLNRWIVPLDKGVDFLSLHTGRKFPIPFSAMVIFATNLKPEELVDEAFLRRIGYKVHMADPSPDDYAKIFSRQCGERGLKPSFNAVDYIFQNYYRNRGIPVRACHPRDILEKVVEAARWEGEEPELNPGSIDRVCRSYFLVQTRTDEHEGGMR